MQEMTSGKNQLRLYVFIRRLYVRQVLLVVWT